MKEKIKVLIADIKDDLNSLKKIKSDYDLYMKKIDSDSVPDHFDKMIIGYLMHNFYSGCENIFLNIAKVFENNIDQQSWHKSILKRMKLDIDDIRPAVISNELFKLLDDFRAFRHVFRHIYSDELDWEKEKIVANKFNRTFDLFLKEINDFIKFLEELAKKDD